MLGFIKKIFIGLLTACATGSSGGSLGSNFEGSIKCASLNKRGCQARSTLFVINSNGALFHPFTKLVNNWGGGYNTIFKTFCNDRNFYTPIND